MMYSLKDLKNIFINRLETEAERIGAAEPANLYQPVQYTLNMGGKRLRPVMTLMACDLFNGDIEAAMPVALGIEVFHNFTLLHDDIMDKAALRRNKLTVHKKYSENTAILSGDAMSILAFQYLLQTNSPAFHEIAGLFTKTAIEVCKGQQLDMDYQDMLDVSIEDYLEMIRLKTAVLIACSLKAGALSGNASAQDANRLYDFGINLGLAFQLQDDLLDVYADENKFGKQSGGDIVANKKTYLLLKSLELASAAQREKLLSLITAINLKPNEKIASVKKIYADLNIREITTGIIRDYYMKALAGLEGVSSEKRRKSEFLMLAQKIIKREN
ncbi:MAG: polyprenyl synthetase family protein [Prolixibacteraceae bacterium]